MFSLYLHIMTFIAALTTIVGAVPATTTAVTSTSKPANAGDRACQNGYTAWCTGTFTPTATSATPTTTPPVDPGTVTVTVTTTETITD
ncbi:hypothetical protein EW026_g7518 [Hermanssonia centrifuga]|uniref:Uncharacterized protein n=1 Tax=Hermanssonia centrifuga TaxID=98765 RepID=A0A4S4K7M4_9APHY|nr:hypothetical protein EW026_g7518 [Hermanssonia centrifuga]